MVTNYLKWPKEDILECGYKVSTFTFTFSLPINKTTQFYKDGDVHRFKNKRVVVKKLEDGAFIVFTTRYIKFENQEEKDEAIKFGWKDNGRNVYTNTFYVSEETLKVITSTFLRLKE